MADVVFIHMELIKTHRANKSKYLMDSKSFLDKRISTAALMLSMNKETLVARLKEVDKKASSSTIINEIHLPIFAELLIKFYVIPKQVHQLWNVQLLYSEKYPKHENIGKTVDEIARTLRRSSSLILNILKQKGIELTVDSAVGGVELDAIYCFLEKDDKQKRLIRKEQKAALQEAKKKQDHKTSQFLSQAQQPKKKRSKKRPKKGQPVAEPRFKIIYTPHPKY